MNDRITLKKFMHFPLTKIIAGILAVGGSVALGVWISESASGTQPPSDLTITVSSITEILFAFLSYILFSRLYEKRQVKELSPANALKYISTGLLTGLGLQSLVISVLYFAGGYAVISVNPISYVIPALMFSLTAGFVGEVLLRGILFRITEESLGTFNTVILFALLFVAMHSGGKDATFLSVAATSLQAGFLLSSVYVYSRSLWLPIMLHFAWDFAEPGIYGGINPGINVEKSLLTSKIDGTALFTGGTSGPGNSIQAAIFCLIAGMLFLYFAKRRNNFIKPYWKK